jgi:hypothetical protein
MPDYDGPLYAPYDKMLTGKLTKRQWQEVYTIVRREQKGLLKEMWDKDHYNELTDILDKLYPLAYTSKEQLPDDWSFE